VFNHARLIPVTLPLRVWIKMGRSFAYWAAVRKTTHKGIFSGWSV